MIIKIVCTEPIGLAVLKNLDAMQVIAGDALKAEDLSVEVNLKPREHGPRVQYRALLPTGTVDHVRGAIERNIEDFGSHTVKGIVYRDLATATLDDCGLTEKAITSSHAFASKSVQRALVELRGDGFAISLPLIRDVAE